MVLIIGRFTINECQKMSENPDQIEIQVVVSLKDFLKLEEIWKLVLKDSNVDLIFLTFEWFSSFIRSFNLQDRLFIILIYSGTDPVGILPFYRDRDKLFGLHANVLRSITNVHTPKYNFIVKTGYEDFVERALNLSREKFSWDFVQIDYVVEDSFLVKTFCAKQQKSVSVKRVEKLKSPHLAIDCDWPEYWNKRIPKSLRNDVKRLERQAGEKYGVQFEPVSGDLLEPEDLKEAFTIEDSGWKGRDGSSILKNPEFEAFYHELAFCMNRKGWFELFFLSFGGKRVAFEYCLKYNSFICPLKIGYEDNYKRYGLGNMLRRMILEKSFANRYEKYDLLGSIDSYKLKWTNRIDVLYSLYIFNRKVKSRMLNFLLFGASELADKMGIKNYLKKGNSKIKGLLGET
ncbi:GNAT family N-acetyltransferase [Thermodesulfobacteriota bacterium]